jgi:tetrahydromethanopterin S-methyltransferase subunit G
MSVQVTSSQGLPREAVQSLASGIFFLTFFGGAWALWGTSFLQGALHIGAYVLIGLITLAFFVIGARLSRYARTLPQATALEDVATGKRIGRWFGIVFGAEVVLILLAAILLSRFGAGRFIAPMIALIVGVHFFPLAGLFHVRAYYLVGALLCLLALIAIVALLLGLQIAGPSPDSWSYFVGIGAALVLWLTLLYLSRRAIGLMRQGA